MDKTTQPKKKLYQTWYFWVILGVVGLMVGMSVLLNGHRNEVPTSVGLKLLEDKKVTRVELNDDGNRVELTTSDPVKHEGRDLGKKVTFTYSVTRGQEVAKAIAAAEPEKGFEDRPQTSNWLLSTLGLLLPMIIILGLFLFLMSRAQGGSGKIMQFGKSRAKMINKDMPEVTFKDVAGVDEAVEELREIQEFLLSLIHISEPTRQVR